MWLSSIDMVSPPSAAAVTQVRARILGEGLPRAHVARVRVFDVADILKARDEFADEGGRIGEIAAPPETTSVGDRI